MLLGIFIRMIKLKTLITENNQEWANGTFDYTEYSQLSPQDRLNMAVAFLQTPNAKDLTASEVYHIILSVPRGNIRKLYDLASHYLSPEQLADTKKQVDAFYE